MLLNARCKKCGCTGKVDTEGLTKEQTISKLKQLSFGECPFGGFHVELGKILDYIDIDWGDFR